MRLTSETAVVSYLWSLVRDNEHEDVVRVETDDPDDGFAIIMEDGAVFVVSVCQIKGPRKT